MLFNGCNRWPVFPTYWFRRPAAPAVPTCHARTAPGYARFGFFNPRPGPAPLTGRVHLPSCPNYRNPLKKPIVMMPANAPSLSGRVSRPQVQGYEVRQRLFWR